MDLNVNKTTIAMTTKLNSQAVLWVLAGTGIFSIIFASGKFFGGADWVWQIIFFRYLSGLMLMLVIAKFKRGKIEFSPKWPLHISRALVGGAGGYAAIYAAANMPVADAAAIGLLDSVIAIVLGIFIFGEFISAKRWYAIAGCLIGALVVLFDRGAFQGTTVLGLPALIALCGAIFLAIESVLIRALATAEDIIVVLLQVNLFGTLLFAIPAINIWDATNIEMKLLLCLLGPLAILGQYCNIRGYQMAGLSIVAPVGYSWIIFALAIDQLFFGVAFGYLTILGATAILISGYLLTRSADNA
ncbi:MAG: hypothetical protein OFPII_38570 [Osedax symbiont Rs1]|nr:MAG: hypothetical protein OFPII_38570 [Osedax symbiont Rs1]